MWLFSTGTLASLMVLTAAAQQAPAPAPQVFISPAEVARLIALVKTGPRDGTQLPAASRVMVSWGPFSGNVIYRTIPTELYFVNEDYAEYYMVLDGEGTMNVGGTMINPKRSAARLESTELQGGTPYSLTRGAMVMVPPGTAHRITGVKGELVYMSMHLPLQAVPGPTAH